MGDFGDTICMITGIIFGTIAIGILISMVILRIFVLKTYPANVLLYGVTAIASLIIFGKILDYIENKGLLFLSRLFSVFGGIALAALITIHYTN